MTKKIELTGIVQAKISNDQRHSIADVLDGNPIVVHQGNRVFTPTGLFGQFIGEFEI